MGKRKTITSAKRAANKRRSQKIRKLIHEGYPQKQAVAIAYSYERRRKPKRKTSRKTKRKSSRKTKRKSSRKTKRKSSRKSKRKSSRKSKRKNSRKPKTRRSCKNGKLKKPVRTKSGRKRRCKKSYRMHPSAPTSLEVEGHREDVKQLMERLSKNPGVYEFVDLGGNTKSIDLFTPIKDEKASRQSGEPKWEPVYKRVERAFGKPVRIFRRCYPDISQVLSENIPNDKLIFKGYYYGDSDEYNKKHNIKDYSGNLKGFQLFYPYKEEKRIEYYDELSLMNTIYWDNENIPELIAKTGKVNSTDTHTINKRIKGKNILESLDVYRDNECRNNKQGWNDLREVTFDFRHTSTLLTEYKYDGKIIPYRQVVNGIQKYSPAILPIDQFIIFGCPNTMPPNKKGWFD